MHEQILFYETTNFMPHFGEIFFRQCTNILYHIQAIGLRNFQRVITRKQYNYCLQTMNYYKMVDFLKIKVIHII